MQKNLLLIGVLTLCNFTFSQSIQRSGISSSGSTSSGDNITVQQTVGQPYQTKSYYSNEIESRPGFIQPSQFTVELIRSTFTVEMNVYPNPTTTQVDFKLNENLENVVLRVVDQYGKMMFREDIESLRNYTLDCTSWTSGNYFIHISDRAGNSYQSKLIKQ